MRNTPTGLVASKIVELIRQKTDKPFFLAAGFFNPHCPYVAPKKYFDLYPLDQITHARSRRGAADLEDVPAMAIQRDTKNWPYYFEDVTVEQARKCKQAYYATISFVDAQVGRLLDALEENDLMENTIIVFWSDHGYFLGEKGLWYKRKAFERSARMPLIIAAPGLSKGEAHDEAGRIARPVSYARRSVRIETTCEPRRQITPSIADRSVRQRLEQARRDASLAQQESVGLFDSH